MSEQIPEEIASVRFSIGRYYLSVAGICVAMQGDNCRDDKLEKGARDRTLLVRVAETINAALSAAISSERESCAQLCHEYAERAREDRRNADERNDIELGNHHHSRMIAAQELERAIRDRAESKGK